MKREREIKTQSNQSFQKILRARFTFLWKQNRKKSERLVKESNQAKESFIYHFVRFLSSSLIWKQNRFIKWYIHENGFLFTIIVHNWFDEKKWNRFSVLSRSLVLSLPPLSFSICFESLWSFCFGIFFSPKLVYSWPIFFLILTQKFFSIFLSSFFFFHSSKVHYLFARQHRHRHHHHHCGSN